VDRSARPPATFVDEVHPVGSGQETSPGPHAHRSPAQTQRIPSGCGDVVPGQSVVLKPAAPVGVQEPDFGTDDGTLCRALRAVSRLLSRGFRKWANPGPPPRRTTSPEISSELSF
jgi:hypothetical protein